MQTITEQLNQVIGKDGVKVDIGFNTLDIILLSAGILVAIILGGIILKALTKNF